MNQFFKVNDFRKNIPVFQSFPKAIDKIPDAKHQNQFSASGRRPLIMENFADQCLDMAQSILGHNLESISEQGTISPVAGENSRHDEPGHAALAIGEYYRATNETTLGSMTVVRSVSSPQTAVGAVVASCRLRILSMKRLSVLRR